MRSSETRSLDTIFPGRCSLRSRLGRCWCCVVVAAALTNGGCVEREVPVTEPPPPAVVVSNPLVLELSDYREYPGRVVAVDEVEIRARVTGYLKEVKFLEGEYVEAEDMLFEIDDQTYQAAVAAAKAEVDRAEALVIKTEADLERYKKLLDKNATTQEEYDTALGARDASLAELAAAQAAFKSAEIDLAFTKISAPVAGRIGQALITAGNLITADRSEGVPLTTIRSVAPVYVYFNVDEYTINTLRAQRMAEKPELRTKTTHVEEMEIPVYAGLSNEDGFPHAGLIDFADNQIDPATGTLRIRGEFPNEDQVLLAGSFARVRLVLSEPKPRIMIPEYAVGTDLTQKYVFVVDADNVAQKRTVKLGDIRAGDDLRSVEEGLTADDRVIVQGLQLVRELQEVKAEEQPLEAPEIEDLSQPDASDASGDEAAAADESTPTDTN